MAAITDKFNKAANGTGSYPSVASVTATREKDGSVLTCDDLAGWATDTPVHFSTYRLMSDGSVDTSTQSDWKGIVSGNTITQVTRLAGNQDSGHLVGDKVELNPTIGWVDDLVTGLLKAHNQDGSLKDSIVQAKSIADGAISTSKIADKAITSTKLGEKAVKSENVDYQTLFVQAPTTTVTSLAVNQTAVIQSLTVPAGKWKISGQFNGRTGQSQTYQADISLVKDGEQFSHLEVSGVGTTTSEGQRLPISASLLGVVSTGKTSTIQLKARVYDHSLGEIYTQACWLIAERVG